MAKKLTYRDDRNIAYAVSLDAVDFKGNVSGNAFFASAINSAPALPAKIKMRYVNAYLKSNPKIRRRFYLGSLAARNAAIAGGVLLGLPLPSAGIAGNALLSWTIVSCRGELRQF